MLLTLAEISEKSKNIAVIRVLNRLLYNLNNGFHQQEKKTSKRQCNTFSPGLKNVFALAGMKTT